MKTKICFLTLVFVSFLFVGFNASSRCTSSELEIVNVFPCDQTGNFQSEFEIGSKIHFNLTLRNPTSEPKDVTIRFVLFDTLLDPIGDESLGIIMPSNCVECYTVGLTIPRWAHVGQFARAYVNILEAFSCFPIVPEENIEFTVTPCSVNPSEDPSTISDIIAVAEAFGSTPPDPNWNLDADINQDGIINIVDVVAVAVHSREAV